MPNTSATGGYLLQNAGPIDGQALRRFLHDVLVGVTGLPNDLVRQNWQQNPPTMPSIDTNWLGFGIISQQQDASAYHSQLDDSAELIRHEVLEILCSFYGPDCLENVGKLRDGLQLQQNSEALFLVGMGLVDFGAVRHVPELVNDVFFNRADIVVTIRREVIRDYSVLPILSAQGSIVANRDTEDSTLGVSFSA